MRSILLDTDVLIDFLRGHSIAFKFLESFGETDRLCVSTLTIAELLAGVRSSKEAEKTKEFLMAFEKISINSEIAELAGTLKNKHGKSHGLGLADAVIAATCLSEKSELATLNVKHYPMIKGLKPAYRK